MSEYLEAETAHTMRRNRQALRSSQSKQKVAFPGDSWERIPVVSVVIPCYNYAAYLRYAVESVLSQEGVGLEIIVVDDLSTDDSLLIARRLASEDKRIQVVARRVNGGPVAAFNDGLSRAEGDYLVRLDADDLLTPGSLARSVAVAEHFPEVGLVYGHPLHFEGTNLPQARSKTTSVTIWRQRQWLKDRCRSGHNVITSPEVLMRTSVVRRVGGQADLAHTHDMEHWLRISAFADVAYLHGADQAWHREHAQSLSARKVTGPLDLEQRLLAFETLFSVWGAEIDPTGSLQCSARESIARLAVEAANHALDAGLSWNESVVPYRAFALRIGATVPRSLVRAEPVDLKSPWKRTSGQWRRLRRGIRHRLALRRWHSRGVY